MIVFGVVLCVLGASWAGGCVLAAPAVALCGAFQKHFTTSDIGSASKG
jgi:multiple sugar transport system permease protein